MILKCVCTVTQSAAQAREGVILHLTVADTPKASQGSYEQEQLSSNSHPHPLPQHLPFSLGSCSILAGKYPECLQENVKQRCPHEGEVRLSNCTAMAFPSLQTEMAKVERNR